MSSTTTNIVRLNEAKRIRLFYNFARTLHELVNLPVAIWIPDKQRRHAAHGGLSGHDLRAEGRGCRPAAGGRCDCGGLPHPADVPGAETWRANRAGSTARKHRRRDGRRRCASRLWSTARPKGDDRLCRSRARGQPERPEAPGRELRRSDCAHHRGEPPGGAGSADAHQPASTRPFRENLRAICRASSRPAARCWGPIAPSCTRSIPNAKCTTTAPMWCITGCSRRWN